MSARKPKEAPTPRAYLSTSGGEWSVICDGSAGCARTTEERAREHARRMRLDLSHGRIWDGDAGEWREVQP